MQSNIELKYSDRSDTGTAASRRLRRLQTRIPAIVYGGDTPPASISIHRFDLEKVLEQEAFYSTVLTLTGESGKVQVVLKAIDHHPIAALPQHLDFQRVTPRSIISQHVPIHFLGEDQCVGVKTQGGVIAHQLSEVTLRGRVSDLPAFIEIDMSELSVGENVRLSGLKLGARINIPVLDRGQDQIIAAVITPRGGISDEDEEGAEGQAEAEDGEGSDTDSEDND